MHKSSYDEMRRVLARYLAERHEDTTLRSSDIPALRSSATTAGEEEHCSADTTLRSSPLRSTRATQCGAESLRSTRPLRILDVGSRQMREDGFGKTYRDLMAEGTALLELRSAEQSPLPARAWRYTGCDVAAGPNVDLVQLGPYLIQEEGGQYDVVISGQCLEHVENPFLLVQEMGRMCRPGGLVILTAPWEWHYHPHPLDCWRILPDGMRALLKFAQLDILEAYLVEKDCWGIGRAT